LSGEIRFVNHIVLGSIEQKSFHLDNTTDEFRGNVSENEIYSISKNNGFYLGFKNITNYKMYKNNIQGSVKWDNDWIYFSEGLLKFPFLEHLGTTPIKIPIYIREMYINPALFENRSDKGTLQIPTSNIINHLSKILHILVRYFIDRYKRQLQQSNK